MVDYAYLLRAPDGAMRVEHDRHVEGLFSRAATGSASCRRRASRRAVVPFEHSELEPGSHEVFVAKRPAG